MKKIPSALLPTICLPALAQEPADNKIFRRIQIFIYDQTEQPTIKENAEAQPFTPIKRNGQISDLLLLDGLKQLHQ